MIPGFVYLLCAATALLCMALLWRGYRRSRLPLLFWTACCFLLLTVNNLLLFVDLIVLPTQMSLHLIRNLVYLGALGVLLFGMVWDRRGGSGDA